jgi:hypothetical protein
VMAVETIARLLEHQAHRLLADDVDADLEMWIDSNRGAIGESERSGQIARPRRQ